MDEELQLYFYIIWINNNKKNIRISKDPTMVKLVGLEINDIIIILNY